MPATDVIGGKAKVILNEPLYFHSSLNDYTVTLIIEIAIAAGSVYQSIGWSILRIFSNIDKLLDTKEPSQAAQMRYFNFYTISSFSLTCFLILFGLFDFQDAKCSCDTGITTFWSG